MSLRRPGQIQARAVAPTVAWAAGPILGGANLDIGRSGDLYKNFLIWGWRGLIPIRNLLVAQASRLCTRRLAPAATTKLPG